MDMARAPLKFGRMLGNEFLYHTSTEGKAEKKQNMDVIALHEAGHALSALMLDDPSLYGIVSFKVNNIRNETYGFISSLPRVPQALLSCMHQIQNELRTLFYIPERKETLFSHLQRELEELTSRSLGNVKFAYIPERPQWMNDTIIGLAGPAAETQYPGDHGRAGFMDNPDFLNPYWQLNTRAQVHHGKDFSHKELVSLTMLVHNKIADVLRLPEYVDAVKAMQSLFLLAPMCYAVRVNVLQVLEKLAEYARFTESFAVYNADAQLGATEVSLLLLTHAVTGRIYNHMEEAGFPRERLVDMGNQLRELVDVDGIIANAPTSSEK